MGRAHSAALTGINRAQADEQLREAETRRSAAERERQLLTSYLGTQEQVAGTGRFNASADVLKYTQRYAVDARALAEINEAGGRVKRQTDPFQSYDAGLRGGQSVQDYGQGFVTKANDLLAQAEAAARAGDTAGADRLYQQAQSVISGVQGPAASAFNLVESPESAAAIRASSAEGKIVGRQLLTAQELGDPNSQTTTELRGRLLDPSLMAIDENTRAAERAIASERSEIEGQIRQQGAAGGVGINQRAQLALEQRAASQAALQRAQVYSGAGAQRAQVTAQVNLYLNEFTTAYERDAVALAQAWVNGTPGVRDSYLNSLEALSLIGVQMSNQWAQFYAIQGENRRAEQKGKEAARRGVALGIAQSFLPNFSELIPGIGNNTPSEAGGGGGGGGGAGLGALSSVLGAGASAISAGVSNAVGGAGAALGGAGASAIAGGISGTAGTIGSGLAAGAASGAASAIAGAGGSAASGVGGALSSLGGSIAGLIGSLFI